MKTSERLTIFVSAQSLDDDDDDEKAGKAIPTLEI